MTSRKLTASRKGHKVVPVSTIATSEETSPLPALIAGQKGLVEEKELRIPSMRGIMTARTKPLELVESSLSDEAEVSVLEFEKPLARSECKMISADNVVELVEALANDAKII